MALFLRGESRVGEGGSLAVWLSPTLMAGGRAGVLFDSRRVVLVVLTV